MPEEKEKTIYKRNVPIMVDPLPSSAPENSKSSPEERIKLAIKYLFEQQKALQAEQQQAHSELHNAYDQLKNSQVHLDTALERLNVIQSRLAKKSVSLEKLISDRTTSTEKQTLADAIITLHDTDL